MPRHCTVFVQSVPGIKDLQFSVPLTQPVDELKRQIKEQLPSSILPRVGICTLGGRSIARFGTVEEIYVGTTGNETVNEEEDEEGEGQDIWLNLRISVALCGGKGGFGTLLKQSAGTMNKKKGKNMRSNSKDLYKTLDGRRVSVIKRIKQLEEKMEQMPEQERKRVMEKKEKLQRILDIDLEKNVKFEDTQFLEEIDKQMEAIREEMDLDDEGDEDDESDTDTDTDSDIDEDKEQIASSSNQKTQKKKKFTKFFDEDDDMPPPKTKAEGKQPLK